MTNKDYINYIEDNHVFQSSIILLPKDNLEHLRASQNKKKMSEGESLNTIWRKTQLPKYLRDIPCSLVSLEEKDSDSRNDMRNKYINLAINILT